MSDQGHLSFIQARDGTLVIQLVGAWSLKAGIPAATETQRQVASAGKWRRVDFDARELTSWDSSVVTFLVKVSELCQQRNIPMNREGLPVGVQKLLALAEAVPERKGARREVREPSFLERVGTDTLGFVGAAKEILAFLGDMTVTFLALFRMRARYRASDLFLLIQQCGAQALPIVTLISFLVGVILAFVGAVQLKQFGAQIYVADLVGIAMMREMGAMMTGIIMAGRTGAAFAAQIGTMKVTQEVDAFTTAGFSPLEFLVLPRVMALILMMPLLCLYADFVGVIGG